MIRSMTGYGMAEAARENCKMTVEMKAVNNRYLDFNIRLPRVLNPFEARIRSLLKQYMQRGKVDVYVSYEDLSESSASVLYHREVAEQYYRHLHQIAEDFGLESKISVTTLASYPDVLKIEEEERDIEVLWEPLQEALSAAAAQFLAAREKEGEFLKDDILKKLTAMEGDVAFIEEKAPEMVERFRAGLKEKVSELLQEKTMDEGRIIQEVTIYADKVSIDEELVRLKSHIKAMRDILGGDENVGRKMDFLAQEMNRESNTILSKSDDLSVSDHAIELKTNVEKIREQVQNIE
ncbi:MAG: YicC family protein [Lachnospiraceae bacterium]|nr:YicC family protein [Lachnospiraceae bacterium]